MKMSHDVKELIEGLNEDLAGEYAQLLCITIMRLQFLVYIDKC